MTDQEKLAAQEAERAWKNREEALRIRKQFDARGIAGEPCGFSMEETYLPMADGIRLYMRIYRPEGKSAYPVLIQRSCYPHQMEIYEVYGEELA